MRRPADEYLHRRGPKKVQDGRSSNLLLCPEVRALLVEWMKVVDISPEALIVPWKWRKTKTTKEKLISCRIRDIWDVLRDKWGLPDISPRDLRHWAATTCRKMGLSKVATAAMLGHDPTTGDMMVVHYDDLRPRRS